MNDDAVVDAAIAGLVGAAIGMTGSLFTPLIVAWRARIEARHERMRLAYEDAYRAIARLSYVTEVDRAAEFIDLMSAHARIQLYGKPKVTRLLGEVVTNVALAMDDPSKAHLREITRRHLIEFVKLARRDIGTDFRTPKLLS